jgi:hypothetical protein
MDAKIIADAAMYAKLKAANLAYYYAHQQEISEQRKQKYRETHPNPRPRGRPRKVVAADPPPVKPVWEDCGLCNEGVFYFGEGEDGPCPFCVAAHPPPK